jgi:DNA-binding transcriptional ArsR family regulator
MDSPDRIEKRIVLRAPCARVWDALADSQKFGQWFGVAFAEPPPARGCTGRLPIPAMNIFVSRSPSNAWSPDGCSPGAGTPTPSIPKSTTPAPGTLVARLSSAGPMSISRLTRDASMTRQAVTKHLHVLAHAGLARSSHVGRESVWEFQPAPLDAARTCLDGISAQWDAALGRLKLFVED